MFPFVETSAPWTAWQFGVPFLTVSKLSDVARLNYVIPPLSVEGWHAQSAVSLL